MLHSFNNSARACITRFSEKVKVIKDDPYLKLVGDGAKYFKGDHLIYGKAKGGSVVTENPKGRNIENFGRIQRGDNSNLLGK